MLECGKMHGTTPKFAPSTSPLTTRPELTRRGLMSKSIPDQTEWRAVPTHAGYFVNALGQILGPRGRVLRPMVQDKTGHLYVLTYKRRPRKLFVHRAVLMAFVGMPKPGQEGRHLDGNPDQNAAGNLAWGTRQQNSDDKQRHGTHPKGERSGTAKLTEADVREIRRLYGSQSLRSLAARFGVSHTAIRRAALGIKWGSVIDG